MIRTIFALAMATLAFASPDDWPALGRIDPSQQTVVQTSDRKRYEGAFVSYSADALIIKTRKGEQSIEKSRVEMVFVRSKPRSHSARKGAIIAGAIGVAAVIPTYGASVGAIPAVAGIGALIGLSQNTMTPVYRK